MIRFIKKLFTLAVSLVLLVTFGYCVVLPRVLPLKYQDMVKTMRAEGAEYNKCLLLAGVCNAIYFFLALI